MDRKQVARIVAVIVLGGLLLMGLQSAIGSGFYRLMRLAWDASPQQGPISPFESVRINLGDLPEGWRMGGGEPEDVPGAEAYIYWYFGTSDPHETWINVSQKMIQYEDADAAAGAFRGWVDWSVPPSHRDKWIMPEELVIDCGADEMAVACLPRNINGLDHYACTVTALYGDMVVVLWGNVFDTQWLTMQDFRSLLEAMDERMVNLAGTR